MAKANWFDILSSPQYEQGGRFNLLSIPQLIYGATPSGRQEIGRRKGLRERTEELVPATGEEQIRSSEAQRGLIGAQTGRVGAETTGLGISNQTSQLAFKEAQDEANRKAAARQGLMGSLDQYIGSKVPADLPPEATGEFLSLYGGASTLGRQQETEEMSLDQNRKLYEQGNFAITPQAQFAQEFDFRKTLGEREASGREEAVKSGERSMGLRLLGDAYQSQNPEFLRHVIETLKKSGIPVAEFGGEAAPAGPYKEIDAKLRERMGGGQKLPQSAPALTPQQATQSRSPLMSPGSAQPQLQGQQNFLPGMFGKVVPEPIPGFGQLPPDLQMEVRQAINENPSYSLNRIKEIIDFLLRERVR